VYSFTIQHIGLDRSDDPYPARVLGIATLAEGYHMFTEFLTADPAAVRIDDPIVVVFHDVGEGLVLPKFQVLPR